METLWTQEEIKSLAAAVYQRRQPNCPRCGNRIRGEFIRLGQRRTVPIDLHCDHCRLRAEYDPFEIEEQNLAWTESQKLLLVNQYRRQGKMVTCPADGAYLVDMPSREQKDYFKLHCPHCGRRLVSSEVA